MAAFFDCRFGFERGLFNGGSHFWSSLVDLDLRFFVGIVRGFQPEVEREKIGLNWNQEGEITRSAAGAIAREPRTLRGMKGRVLVVQVHRHSLTPMKRIICKLILIKRDPKRGKNTASKIDVHAILLS